MRFLRWAAGIVVAGVLLQYLAVVATPHVVMRRFWSRLASGGPHGDMTVNGMTAFPVSTADARWIVRPSPDLLYSMCPYDLRQGPVVIEAEVPGTYWSLQLYQMNTDNFAGRNNQREQSFRKGGPLSVVIVGAGEQADGLDGDVIVSPTDRGVAVIRMAIIGEIDEHLTVQARASCRAH